MLLGAGAAATLGIQLVLAIRTRDLPVYRGAALLWSLALLVWAGRSRAPAVGRILPRLACALAAAGGFWLALLELLLGRGSLLARGVLGVLAGAASHVTMLLFVLEPGGHEPRRGITAHVALAAAAGAWTLFAVEGVFHTVLPANVYEIFPDDPRSPPCLVPDPVLHVRLRPGFRGRYLHPEFPGLRVDINDLGFRDGLEETAPPPAEDASVLVLGDSLAFGTGVAVDETFHRLLERQAGQITSRPLHVYGAGVPGLGQVDELHHLEALAPVVRPDVVIVAIYEGNDLQDNLEAAVRPRRAFPSPAPAGAAAGPRALLVPFLRAVLHSRFWVGSSAALQYVLPTIERPLVRLGVPPLVPTNDVLDQSLMVSRQPLVVAALAWTRDALARIARQCADRGADLVVLLIPAAIQAEPVRFDDFLAQHPAAQRKGYSRTRLHQDLLEMVRTLGVRIVDPLPRLEAEALAGRPCYHREGHWNARGHAVAAELLRPVLAELLAERERRGKWPRP